MNRTCITILGYHLDESENYQGVCDAFEKYFNFVKTTTELGMGQRPDSLLNEQVTMWTKALYKLVFIRNFYLFDFKSY